MSTAARVALKKCAYAAQYPEQAEEFLLNLFWFSVFTFTLRDLFFDFADHNTRFYFSVLIFPQPLFSVFGGRGFGSSRIAHLFGLVFGYCYFLTIG